MYMAKAPAANAVANLISPIGVFLGGDALHRAMLASDEEMSREEPV
jgi:hypothetical protein